MIYLGLLAVAVMAAIGAAITVLATARIEAAHRPSGRLVPVTGGKLHVIDLLRPGTDARLPLVMVHGASGNAEDLRLAMADRLARHRRVILIDRPGHGWSDRPAGASDASPARQAALIREALDRVGVERFVLLGHSLGGAVATAFALAYPERLAGLVLLAPVTHPWIGSGMSWYNVLASLPVVGRLFAHTVALPAGVVLLDVIAPAVFAPQRMPTDYVRRAAIRMLLRPSQFIANAQDVAVLKRSVAAQVPRYKDIKTPTLIMTGSADTVVSLDIHARAIAAVLPNAKLVVLDGIGHMPHHVATDAVVAAIEAHVPEPLEAAREGA